MIDLLTDLILTGLILLSIYGFGAAIRSRIRLPQWSRSADLAFTLGFGLGASVTILFLFSLVGLLIPLIGWGMLIVGLILASVFRHQMIGAVKSIKGLRGQSWFVKGATLLLFAFALMNLIADLAPPIEGDTVHQYLITVRYWVEAGRYIQPTHIWAGTLPGNMMMLSAWALLLRESYSLASLVSGFGMSLFFALGVYALARSYFNRTVGLLAVAVIYTMPDAGYLAQSAKVDMGWAFFEVLAFIAFFRWLDRADNDNKHTRWLILAGLWLGLAAGSKNQAVISVALLGLWLLLVEFRRKSLSQAMRSGAIFGIAVIIVALPYYLYNGIIHSNPFYPVFADQFVALFNATPSPRSELGTEVFYAWTVGGYFTNLWNMSLGHPPGFYLGFITGPVYLLVIPVGILTGSLRRQPKLWRMLAYAFVFSILWFLIKQAARHFIPGLVLLSVVVGFILWRINNLKTDPTPNPLPASKEGALNRHLITNFRRTVLAMVLLSMAWNLISELGVLYWSGAYRVGLGMETRTEYLERWHDEVIIAQFPDWETITYLNENFTSADRILTNQATSSLYITPAIVSDNWGDRIAYHEISDPEDLIQALKENGIGYILIYDVKSQRNLLYDNHEFLETYTEFIYETPRARLYRLRE